MGALHGQAIEILAHQYRAATPPPGDTLGYGITGRAFVRLLIAGGIEGTVVSNTVSIRTVFFNTALINAVFINTVDSGSQRGTVGTHQSGYIRPGHLPACQQFEGPEHGIVEEGPTLHHNR